MARIKVRLKATGQIGMVDDNEFNPAIYESVQEPTQDPTAQATPTPPQSLAAKIGGGVVGLAKGLMQPVERFGTGLGTGLGLQSEAQKGAESSEKQLTQQISMMISKASQLNQEGKKEEADRLLKLAQEQSKTLQGTADVRISEAEAGKEDVIKGAIGTGALFVPGGLTPTTAFGKAIPGLTMGAGGRIAASTLSGVGSGIGVSEKGKELEAALGGGVFGLAGGAGAEGLGVVGKKWAISRATKEAAKKGKLPTITGAKVPPTPFWSSTVDELTEQAAKEGIDDTMKSVKKMSLIENGFTRTDGEIRQILNAADDVNPNVVNKNLVAYADEYLPNPQNAQFKRAQKLLSEAKTNEKLYQLKQTARGEMGNAFNKNVQDLSEKQKVWATVWNGIKDSFDTISDDIRILNKEQHNLFGLAAEFKPGAVKAGQPIGVRVPMTTRGIETPLKSEAADIGSRKLFGGVGALLGLPGRGAGGVASMVGQSPQMARNIAIQAMLGKGAEEPTTPELQIPGVTDAAMTQPQTGKGIPIEVLADARAKLSAAEFKKVLQHDQLLRTGVIDPDESALVKKRQLLMKQASPVVAQIITAGEEAPTGMIGSGLALAGKIPGVAGGQAEFLSRDVEGYARLIANVFASEVGVATDKDVERWKSIMPRPGDTKSERKRQSLQLINRIVAESQALNMPVPQEIITAAALLGQ